MYRSFSLWSNRLFAVVRETTQVSSTPNSAPNANHHFKLLCGLHADLLKHLLAMLTVQGMFRLSCACRRFFDDEFIKELIKSRRKAMHDIQKELIVSGMSLRKMTSSGDGVCVSLVDAVYGTQRMRNLRYLDVHGKHIGSAGVTIFANLLVDGALPDLRWLDLSDNHIGPAGCTALAKSLAHLQPGLEWLNLAGNLIGDVGCAAIGEVCSKKTLEYLEELDLERNSICNMEGLTGACANGGLRRLRRIYLGGNAIGDAGLRALADARDAWVQQVRNERGEEHPECRTFKIYRDIESSSNDVAPVVGPSSSSPRDDEAIIHMATQTTNRKRMTTTTSVASLPPRYFTTCCNVLTRWDTCPRCRNSLNPPPAPQAKRRREEDETPRQPSRPEGSPSAPPTEYHPGTSKLGKDGKHWVVETVGPRGRHVWEPAPSGFRPPPPRETPPMTSGANLALIEGRRKLPPRSVSEPE